MRKSNTYMVVDLPLVLSAWVRAHTRKRKIRVSNYLGSGSNYTRRASEWSGGTRTFYDLHVLSEDGRRLVRVPWPKESAPGGFPNFFPAEPFQLPERAIVVETGTFCGKSMAPYFCCTDSALSALGLKSEFESDDN